MRDIHWKSAGVPAVDRKRSPRGGPRGGVGAREGGGARRAAHAGRRPAQAGVRARRGRTARPPSASGGPTETGRRANADGATRITNIIS